jgi:hypothetical protein
MKPTSIATVVMFATSPSSGTYTPDPDFNESDRFTYTVTSEGMTETAFVDVVINPFGITASRYDLTTGRLVLTGSVSLKDYQRAIAAKYNRI